MTKGFDWPGFLRRLEEAEAKCPDCLEAIDLFVDALLAEYKVRPFLSMSPDEQQRTRLTILWALRDAAPPRLHPYLDDLIEVCSSKE